MLEVEDKKRTEEFISGKAFTLIDKAEKLVKNYELKIKKEILLFDSPYEEVISLYKEARKFFKELGEDFTSQKAFFSALTAGKANRPVMAVRTNKARPMLRKERRFCR